MLKAAVDYCFGGADALDYIVLLFLFSVLLELTRGGDLVETQNDTY